MKTVRDSRPGYDLIKPRKVYLSIGEKLLQSDARSDAQIAGVPKENRDVSDLSL